MVFIQRKHFSIYKQMPRDFCRNNHLCVNCLLGLNFVSMSEFR